MVDFVEAFYKPYVEALETAMEVAGDKLCESMRKHYDMTSPHPFETGNLMSEDHLYSQTVNDGEEINTYVFADATSDDGYRYAEFLEYGTGKAHTGHGRDGFWFYKDRHGEWHMTNGMDAKPFIEPAAEEVFPEIKSMFDDIITDISVKRYKGWGK